jgi:hypothetical protein
VLEYARNVRWRMAERVFDGSRSSVCQQQTNDRAAAVGRSVVQWSAVVLAGNVWVGTGIEEVGDDLNVVANHSDLERGVAGAAPCVDANLVAGLELKLILSEVSEELSETCFGGIIWHRLQSARRSV